jgi:hypothetical protein
MSIGCLSGITFRRWRVQIIEPLPALRTTIRANTLIAKDEKPRQSRGLTG